MTKQIKKKRLKKKPISEARLQLAQFILLLNKGKTREEIIEEMGLNPNQFESLFNNYYTDAESEQQNKSPLRIFAEVVGRKTQLIRDLEDLKVDIKKGKYKNAQAFVAAIKTQSDMIDSLVKLGQDLQLIIKAPDQLLLVGGQDVRDMDSEKLKLTVMQEISEVNRMVQKGKSKKGNANNVVTFPGLAEQRDSQP